MVKNLQQKIVCCTSCGKTFICDENSVRKYCAQCRSDRAKKRAKLREERRQQVSYR